MHKVLILLLFLLPTANCFGEVWQDENVSITIPDGWAMEKSPNEMMKFVYWSPQEDVMVALSKTKTKN